MPEAIIIISLAVAFYLVLRHYPEAKGEESGGFNLRQLFSKLSARRRKKLQGYIEEEIKKGQEDLIAPIEIDEAKTKFHAYNDDLARLLYEAEKALSENDLRKSEEMALSALSLDRRCSYAYVIIGNVSLERGQFSEAREAYGTAIKCDNEEAEAYFGLGLILVKEENLSNAVENLYKAVSLDRSHANWYAELGKAYSELRQFAKAAKYFKKAASLDIENNEYKKLVSEAEEKQRSHAHVARMK